MSSAGLSLALWLADFYALAGVSLAAVWVCSRLERQPARRLAMARAALLGLAALAGG